MSQPMGALWFMRTRAELLQCFVPDVVVANADSKGRERVNSNARQHCAFRLEFQMPQGPGAEIRTFVGRMY